MRIIRFLLLALFILSSSAQAVASVHGCCPAADCGMVQCLDIGCAPAPA